MRNVTKLAVAIVVASAGIGALLPVHCVEIARRDLAGRNDDENRFQLITQGEGQRDQDLKLLLTRKVFEGGSPGGDPNAALVHGSAGSTPSS